MKKVMCISIAACLSAFSATAQSPVSVSDQNVERSGQEIIVTFNVKVSEDAVRSGEKILVWPSLICQETGGRTDLGGIYVAGLQQEKVLRQQDKLSRRGRKPVEAAAAVCIGNGEEYSYRTVLDYDSSLKPKEYVLDITARKVGCCNVEDVLSEKFNFNIGPILKPEVKAAEPVVAKAVEKKAVYPFLRKAGTVSDGSRGISVRYPSATYTLDPSYMTNAKALKDISDAIRMVIDDDMTDLDRIDIAGYASPEGKVERNQKLALGRANALKDYIMNEFGLSEEIFNVTSGGEDWDGLRALVAASAMPYKDQVLDIIDNAPKEERQTRIESLAGGRPYRSMLDIMYPQLRDACYISVWFEEKEDVVAKDINEAVDAIGEGHYKLALELLMKHQDDPRAWNAIGSAMLLDENPEGACIWFEKAAANGDEDAARNLAGLKEIIK